MEIIRHHFDALDSTNNWAKEHASSIARDKITIITASQQTAGRGRLGRTWVSPPGKNLYATFCFFMDSQRKDIGNLPQLMSLAVAKTMSEWGFKPDLKWPNDLLVHGKKIGGILTETTLIEDKLFVALGVGVNINMSLEEASLIDRPVTSICIESNQTFDIEQFLFLLTRQFLEMLQIFSENGFKAFLSSYQEHLMHQKHQLMTFSDHQKIWEGRFKGINLDGSLSLELEDGQVKIFVSGEPLS